MKNKTINTRKVSVEIIDDVIKNNHHLDSVLNKKISKIELSDLDTAFIKMLVTSSVRRYFQIKSILSDFLSKKIPKKDSIIETILVVGITQLLFMEVPSYAAINTSVDLVKEVKKHRYSGLVNAVLRNVERKKQEILSKKYDFDKFVPDWFFKKLKKEYGLEGANKIIEAVICEPLLDFTIKSEENIDDWSKRLKADILPFDSLRRVGQGKVSELEGYDEGCWWIQDISASIPVKIMGDIKGLKVADLCSAPGGKTAQLANLGALVCAFDRSEKRLKRLTQNLERLKLEAETIAINSTELLENEENKEKFDIVLLDAPCSAVGTIKKNPDILLNRQTKDIDSLILEQRKLIESAKYIVKKEGYIIYCVCSIFSEEGEKQIDKAIKELDMERIPITKEEITKLGGEKLQHIVTKKGDIRILPFYLEEKGGMDGFFIARLRRR